MPKIKPQKKNFIDKYRNLLVCLLLIISILLGILIYIVGDLQKFRTEDSFVGGESIQETTGYSVLEFYKTS